MTLTKRDKRIIRTLQNQDFCFYGDICKRFFPSRSSASQILKRLSQSGHIVLEGAKKLNSNSTLDSMSLSLISQNRLIVRLGEKYKLIKRKPSPWKKTHQLLLFSVKERLERLLETEAVFENQIRDLKHTLYDRSFEPYPDFYLKTEDFKPAVELELNLKSRNRYLLKMSGYRDSSYSHVLYVAAHAKKISRLMKLLVPAEGVEPPHQKGTRS